ncbi:MAG: VCBS repeat-containing protein [Anaerolineae bacterium]|nr:VCBS repeat-containing protein [Anaerolineae bacterium]
MKVTLRSFHVPLLLLLAAALACSSVDDVLGKRPDPATPTPQQFATATPGGRISVSLTTPVDGVDNTEVTSTPFGQIVAPAATATAVMATVQAATAIAAASNNVTQFQPTGCPPLSGPVPPIKPATFSQYPETIGRYLSAGGPPTILEAMLRSWGALNDWGVVQADTDITGDGVVEVIVTVYDPSLYLEARLSPGQLLIYGCSDGGYRLLFSTIYSGETMLPELRRVGDMNGDVRPELAYSQKFCSSIQIFTGLCVQQMSILGWNASLGVFTTLNSQPIDATSSRIAIADIDNDGNLEVLLQYTPGNDLQSGPPRAATDIWDWNGVNYALAITQYEKATYRIHVLHDADYLFAESDWRNAIRQFDRVRDDTSLKPWGVANEAIILRAYAGYRKMLVQIAQGSRANANNTLNTLLAENPPGTPGEGYAAMAQAFMTSYNRSRNRARACEAVTQVAAARPDTLTPLNSYGYGNRKYSITDLCPFNES